MKITFLTFFLVLFSALTCSAASYRERTFNNVKFILPPGSDLKVQGNGLKSSYRYHFIYISGLSTKYEESQDRIYEEAEYYHSKKKDGKHGSNFISISSPTGFVYLADTGSTVEIRINYQEFWGKSEEELKTIFSNLAYSLLIELSKKEPGARAVTLCQDIVEKVFERIPIPSAASLSRFGYRNDAARTVMLLNPKIDLFVSTSSRVRGNGNNFIDQFGLPVQVSFDRRQDPDNDYVYIIQRTQIGTDRASYPTNYLPSTPTGNDNSGKLTLLTTNGDIQNSKSLNTLKFIAYYEGTLGQNNLFVPDGPLNPTAPAPNSSVSKPAKAIPKGTCENPNSICANGSYLLFSDNLADFYENSPNSPPSKPQKGVFGERNPIDPSLQITMQWVPNRRDTGPVWLSVGKRISDMIGKGKVYKNYKLRRVFNRTPILFKDASPETYLLPGDQIFY